MPTQTSIRSLAIVLILTAAGCTQPINWDRAINLQEQERHWSFAATVWGDAWAFSAGPGQVVDLGPVAKNMVLRLSVCEGFKDNARVQCRVFVGQKGVAAFETKGPEEWSDWRLDMSPFAEDDAPCRLVFDCAAPFELGVCELFVPAKGPANVLIFLIDTLRQDHVGCYGYKRNTTPNIDAFARDCVTFTHLMPQSSWTRPSVASLLTSTYPTNHGANDSTDQCRKNLPWLADSLKAWGHETHGYVINLNCLPFWGIGDQFNRHVDVDSENWMAADDALVADDVIQALECLAGRPWFVYAHAMGPHAPYEPPKGYDKSFQPETYSGTAQENARQRALDLYDGEILYTDRQFGRVVEALKRLDLYDDTLIVLVSDHGEEFWEHGGTDHGKTLFEEQLRVPLLMKLPRRKHAGRRLEELVEMVDVAPTILDMLGAPDEPRFQGRSLLPYIESGTLEKRPGYASLFLNLADMRCAKTKALKHIQDVREQKQYWFDLAADPVELRPLDTPPAEGAALPAHIASLDSEGQVGLHMLITRKHGEKREVKGLLQNDTFGAFSMHFPHWRGGALQDQEGIHFSLQLRNIGDAVTDQALRDQGNFDNAHFYAALPPDTQPRLTVTVDGDPVRPEDVYLGSEGRHQALTEAVLDLNALAASSSSFKAAEALDQFGVYLWYVPHVKSVDLGTLDPNVEERLRDMGYLE